MRLHHYLFPHKRNKYKPHVFRIKSVTAIALALVILEGLYLAQVDFIFPKTNFLGAVLPGALVSLTNDDRIANDVPTVSENDLLKQAAQDAANDMATKGYFAHVSPDGKDPWYWLKLVGYNYQYAGENLAMNFTDSSAVESAWMASPEHHANIVKPQYTQIGIGVASGMYQGKEATFVVSFFGSPEIAQAAAQPQKVIATAETKTVAPIAQVLGAQAQVIFTSPSSTISNILYALIAVVLILLVIAIVVKMSVQFIEIIAGGLFLLLVILGLIFFNAKDIPKIQVSSDTAYGQHLQLV